MLKNNYYTEHRVLESLWEGWSGQCQRSHQEWRGWYELVQGRRYLPCMLHLWIIHTCIHVYNIYYCSSATLWTWKINLWIIFQHCTPLFMAVLYGHEDVVVELLDNGADPNISSDVSYVIIIVLTGITSCSFSTESLHTTYICVMLAMSS